MSKEILDKIYKAYQDGAQAVYVNPASLNDVNWLEASYTHPFALAIYADSRVPLGSVVNMSFFETGIVTRDIQTDYE